MNYTTLSQIVDIATDLAAYGFYFSVLGSFSWYLAGKLTGSSPAPQAIADETPADPLLAYGTGATVCFMEEIRRVDGTARDRSFELVQNALFSTIYAAAPNTGKTFQGFVTEELAKMAELETIVIDPNPVEEVSEILMDGAGAEPLEGETVPPAAIAATDEELMAMPEYAEARVKAMQATLREGGMTKIPQKKVELFRLLYAS